MSSPPDSSAAVRAGASWTVVGFRVRRPSSGGVLQCVDSALEDQPPAVLRMRLCFPAAERSPRMELCLWRCVRQGLGSGNE